MKAVALLGRLTGYGVTLECNADRLKIRAPRPLAPCVLDEIRQNKAALLAILNTSHDQPESTPKSGPCIVKQCETIAACTFVALDTAPDVDSKTCAEWEMAAQALPTMCQLFLRAVEKQKRPDGLVSVTPQLCALWRCAEDERGHALRLSGAERVTNTNRHNSNAKSEVAA